jgi:hypothetical protein
MGQPFVANTCLRISDLGVDPRLLVVLLVVVALLLAFSSICLSSIHCGSNTGRPVRVFQFPSLYLVHQLFKGDVENAIQCVTQ